MPPEGRRLFIDVDAALAIRRKVDPVGWLVLEAIASLAPTGEGAVEVACSARSLAELVGVSKDTVARSLRSLAHLRIVERVDHRHELSGRFAVTTYRVDLSSVGITVDVSHPTDPRSAGSTRTRDLRSPPVDQLSLLS